MMIVQDGCTPREKCVVGTVNSIFEKAQTSLPPEITASDLVTADWDEIYRHLKLPARVAEGYYQSMKDGNILVFARAQQDVLADEAVKIFKKSGAVDMDAIIGSGQLSSQRTAS